MNANQTARLVSNVISIASQLALAGIDIRRLLDEAEANGGKLSDETLAEIERDFQNAVDRWDRA